MRRSLHAVLAAGVCASALAAEPAPVGAVPSPSQWAWHKREMLAFVHFGMNTFTDMETGKGGESPDLFAPEQLDCRQWCRIFKETGFRGVVIVAKHADGFCLWPTKTTAHSVASSKWRGGKGDVLAEMAAACKEFDLPLGVYVSLVDHTSPLFGKGEPYVQFVKEQLREVLTQYGPMVEVWFDGVPHVQTTLRGQRFDWEDLWSYVHGLAPAACIFSEIGPDIRWSGNESGEIGIPNWNAVTRRRLREGGQYGTLLRHGDPRGDAWMPAECDVSIHPGWFFHEHQTGAVKSGQRLLDIYLSSVGRGSTLLLNVPPDRRGLIHERDEQALRDFAALRALRFGVNLAQGAMLAEAGGWPLGAPKALVDGNPDTFVSYAATNGNEVELTFQFPKPARIACLELAEHLPLGQRVQDFDLAAGDGNNWTACAAGKTVGYRALTPFPAVTASKFRLRLRSATAPITLSEVAFYADAYPPPSAREETKKP